MLFFFKQKTEYVMRISDWSSDVCYSDLVARAIADGAMAREGRIEIVPGSERELLGRLDAERIEVALTLIRQIGRASCRERACQYGVDIDGRRILNKNNTTYHLTQKYTTIATTINPIIRNPYTNLI